MDWPHHVFSSLIFILLLSFSRFLTSVNGSEKKLVYDTIVENGGGLIAAFGDFDSDRFTDVFIISDHGNSLKLLKSFDEEPELIEWKEIKCTFEDEFITGVIPADFNGDAKMDVLVMTQDSNRNFHKIWLLRGNKTNLECNPRRPLVENARDHPLVLDYNGDMVADFMVETSECHRELWLMSTIEYPRKECLEDLFGVTSIRIPNSNAFVNIRNCYPGSMDFATDIVITTKDNIEYWLNSKGFSVDNKISIRYPDRIIVGQSTFIDLNIDGCIEHIMAVCKTDTEPCTPQIVWYNNDQREWINIADFTNHSDLYFDGIMTQFGFELPFAVRSGDVDSDGYVDLITVMHKRMENGDSKRIAVIFRNIRDDENPERRKFELFWTSEDLILADVELASFIDLQENGKVDIILTVRNSENNNYDIKWIRNTFGENSCFLKILVTSGLCSNNICPNEMVPYGTNQAGPFICYQTSDMNGHPIKGCAAQQSQSSHFALQMPYSIFGLGQTPNFVETVIASIPSGDQPVRRSKWTQIVPDAQVVLIPYPPNETDYWICKLFYTPSNMVSSTLVALAILCAVLIVIIVILHRKEVLEDLAEHEEYKRHWPESR